MSSNSRFTIASLLTVVIVAAIVLSFRTSWFSFFAVAAGLVYLCSSVLVGNIPKSIRKTIESNCIRFDGSVSGRRTKIEMDSLNKLRFDIAAMMIMIVVPSGAMLWLVNKEIAPISVAGDLLPDPTDKDSAKANLKLWQQSTHLNTADHESYKEFLKQAWPVIVGAGLAWVLIGFFIFKSVYFRMLDDLSANARYRGQQYKLQEIADIQDRSKPKTSKGKSSKEMPSQTTC